MVTFVPHLVPLDRGILETIYVRVDAGHDGRADCGCVQRGLSQRAVRPADRRRAAGDQARRVDEFLRHRLAVRRGVAPARDRVLPRQPREGRGRSGAAELQRRVRLRRTDGPAVTAARAEARRRAARDGRRPRTASRALRATVRRDAAARRRARRRPRDRRGARRARQIAPKKVDGLRITDAATLDVVVSVLAGSANTELVAALVGDGVPAVGLTGVDAGFGRAARSDRASSDERRGGRSRPRRRSGRCRSRAGRAARRERLRAGDREPRHRGPRLVRPAARAERERRRDGVPHRGRARRRDLVIAGGTAGVLDDAGESIAVLDVDGIDALIASGTATAGMVAKLSACRTALEAGVASVRIVDGRGLDAGARRRTTRRERRIVGPNVGRCREETSDHGDNNARRQSPRIAARPADLPASAGRVRARRGHAPVRRHRSRVSGLSVRASAWRRSVMRIRRWRARWPIRRRRWCTRRTCTFHPLQGELARGCRAAPVSSARSSATAAPRRSRRASSSRAGTGTRRARRRARSIVAFTHRSMAGRWARCR